MKQTFKVTTEGPHGPRTFAYSGYKWRLLEMLDEWKRAGHIQTHTIQ